LYTDFYVQQLFMYDVVDLAVLFTALYTINGN